MKCDANCKYYEMCVDRGEIIEDGDECEAYIPEPPTVAFLCKDKGTEYCHHTKHIEQARNFEKVGPNVWMEKEPKRGEWEVIGRETFSPTVTYRCSLCKAKEVSCVPNDKPHYCENCGADMRKEGGDE